MRKHLNYLFKNIHTLSAQNSIIIDITIFDRNIHSTRRTTKLSKRLMLITLEQLILKKQHKQSSTRKEQSHVLNWWNQLWSPGRIYKLQRREVIKPESSLSGVEVVFAWTFLLSLTFFLDVVAPESFCLSAKCSNKIQNKLFEKQPENYSFCNAKS